MADIWDEHDLPIAEKSPNIIRYLSTGKYNS